MTATTFGSGTKRMSVIARAMFRGRAIRLRLWIEQGGFFHRSFCQACSGVSSIFFECWILSKCLGLCYSGCTLMIRGADFCYAIFGVSLPH